MATKSMQKNVELISAVRFMIAKAYEAIMHDDFELVVTSVTNGDFVKLRVFDMDIYVSWTHCSIVVGALEILHDDKKTQIGVFYHKATNGDVDVEYVDVPELAPELHKFRELAIKRIRDRLEKALKKFQ
jgi:hypothetical protein